MSAVLGWHFVGDTLRDGRPVPPDGEWLEHDGPVAICESGLHFSEQPLHALSYAPGQTVCRVECEDIVERGPDKAVCRRRKILWRADATKTLRAFARWCALQVIDKWDAPAVVREYLETGDESKRTAARAAAWAASRAAAWDAAWAASRAAAWDAAGAASRAAAWDAAWAAARAAAWAASRDACWAAKNAKLTEMLEGLIE